MEVASEEEPITLAVTLNNFISQNLSLTIIGVN